MFFVKLSLSFLVLFRFLSFVFPSLFSKLQFPVHTPKVLLITHSVILVVLLWSSLTGAPSPIATQFLTSQAKRICLQVRQGAKRVGFIKQKYTPKG